MLPACFLFGVLGGLAYADDRVFEPVGKVAARAATDADLAGLSLDADVSEATIRHMELSGHRDLQRSTSMLCELAQSAQQLAPLLASSLESEYASLVSRRDSSATSALDAFQQRLEQADKRLVGIGLQLGGEGAYSYVRYDEIADAVATQDGSAVLFRAVARFWNDRTRWPVYIEQQTDVSGCHDPGALIEPLQYLGRVWSRAPECARLVVIDVVRQSVRKALSSDSCYCHTQQESLADAAQLAELAGELGFGVPTPKADALQMHLRGDDVRFECLAH